jgi:hypothetical protein
VTDNNLPPEVRAALESPAGQEATRRIGAALGQSPRWVGERLVSVFQALGRKSDFVKRHGKSLKRLLKEIERRERNLKRMNRKTRAVVMGKKP